LILPTPILSPPDSFAVQSIAKSKPFKTDQKMTATRGKRALALLMGIGIVVFIVIKILHDGLPI